MSNAAWVCFPCRLAVRRPATHEGEVRCAQCGGVCSGLGMKVPVPQKRDEKAWRELQEDLTAKAHARREAENAACVRQRHDLEQELRRLLALPTNAGRVRAIQSIRRRLGEV